MFQLDGRAVAASLVLCLSLAACQKSSNEAASPEASSSAVPEAGIAVGPDAKPGISASNGRLVLPVVEGRPGVAYFDASNASPDVATIVGVHIGGVQNAEMHKTEGGKMTAVSNVEISPEKAVSFAPGGLHVMAFGISDSLEDGGSTELTLTFADGDKLSMPITIENMGETMGNGAANGDAHAGMEGMEGMPH